MENETVIKFSARMTELCGNPKRYTNVRFTKYFGGICICYYDTKLFSYFVERICEDENSAGKKNNTKGGKSKDDGKSDSLLESGGDEEI